MAHTSDENNKNFPKTNPATPPLTSSATSPATNDTNSDPNSKVTIHKFANGMTLVAEFMPQVSSAAFNFLVPAGVIYDPTAATGTASLLSDLVFRGAGARNNRQLNDALERLGLQRSSSVSTTHTVFSGALLSDNLLDALEIYADILQRAALGKSHFETCRQLALQNLDSLEDDPRQRISLITKENYLPYPWGRPAPGKREELEKLNYQQTVDFYVHHYTPTNTILSVAGRFNPEKLIASLEKSFGNWQGQPVTIPQNPHTQPRLFHQANDGAQVHIGLMYPSAGYNDANYYPARAAVAILSGGMGSRLFTEVREKRGLCYAVYATHTTTGPYASVFCYAGSTAEKAQQALDVMLDQLKNLHNGITEEELNRAKVGLRASLIMLGESTNARAAACANDYYHLGRVRPLEEIDQAIQTLTVNDLTNFARKYPPENLTVTSIGPKELTLPKL